MSEPAGPSNSRPRRLSWALLMVTVLVTLLIVLTTHLRKRRMRPPESPLPNPEMAFAISEVLEDLADSVRQHWRATGAPPARWSEVKLPAARAVPPVDPWGREFRLEVVAAGNSFEVRIVTYGEDGHPGGLGEAMDRLVTVTEKDLGSE